jgi:hypothetical protein
METYINSVVKCSERRLGDLRIRKEDDGLRKKLLNWKIPKLSRREKIIKAQNRYKEKKKERRLQEERMHIETKTPRKRQVIKPPAMGKEFKSLEVEIIEKENDLGFKKGNKPKVMKTRYQERKENAQWNQLEGNENAISREKIKR